MKLYFLRHADALDGADDFARPLSTLGRKQSRVIGEFLKETGVRFDAAFSSPLVRAMQTAEIVLKSCPARKKLKSTDALRNETTQREFNHWLHALPAHKSILLVGHAPSLTERVCHLLDIADSESLKLSKAGLACLHTEDCSTATLDLFVSAKSLGA